LSLEGLLCLLPLLCLLLLGSKHFLDRTSEGTGINILKKKKQKRSGSTEREEFRKKKSGRG
jgi:hypothetical protein